MGDDDVEEQAAKWADRARLHLVERHWRGLAPPGDLPRRQDLDASALGPALPQAFALEEAGPGVARIRVAGQRLHDWFGTDPRGVPLSAVFDEVGRPALRDALVELFSRPALVEVGLATSRGPLRAPVEGRLLLLPLEGEDGLVTRALGVFGLDGALPAGPRRFAIPPEAPRRVEPVVPRAASARRATDAFPLPSPEPALGLAEKGRPWLRLVVSND